MVGFVKVRDFSELSRNQNSIHVLVKLVKELPASTVKPIYNAMLEHFEAICCDKNGICLIKAFLDNSHEETAELGTKIIENAFRLSVDPYGNYAV